MTQQTIKDYSKYSFEDFLQDDFFIKSVKYPTDESVAFWEKYKQENAGQLSEYDAACLFIGDSGAQQLSESEIDGMWIRINTENTRVWRIRKAWYTGAAVAASIALLMVFRLYLSQSVDQDTERTTDIVAFANQQQPADHHTVEAQLILSDQKTILLTGEESVIRYDSAAIRVSEKEVSKRESDVFNQLVIPRGKRSMLTFGDGTKIWVNAGTRVVYPIEFEKSKREIFVDGEVFLDVTPDPACPFVVRTNDLNIQVLGTRFNVQAYAPDKQKRVALESGSVMIVSRENSNGVLLSPDRMYEYDEGKESVKDVDIRQFVSWIDGLYLYESERLDVVLARLSRYYGKDIVADQASAELRCSGKLDLKEKLDDILNGLAYTAPITCSHQDEKYYIKYHNP